MIMSLFRTPPSPVPALLYKEVVAASRRETFYRDFAIPDTPQGRFEMVVVHACLLLRQTRHHRELEALAQDVVDLMFTELDSALREMGIGDMAVPRRMKKLAGAIYGRFAAYDEAFKSATSDDMCETLRRNIDVADGPGGVMALAEYIRAADDILTRQFDVGMVLAGRINFPPCVVTPAS